MQKKIIALAIASMFVAPVAMAESSFYGSMDGGVRIQSNDDGVNPSFTTFSMKMGQYNTARWGFKGVDDIGNGLKANVEVETSFVPAGVGTNSDMGPTAGGYVSSGAGAPGGVVLTQSSANPFGLIFDRQATVGLESSTMGRFDMGWNYTTSYDVIGTYDPMGYKFINLAMAASSANAQRAGNVKYQIDLNGVRVIAEYIIDDAFQSRQSNYAGAGRAIGVTYAANGLNLGAAYTAHVAAITDPATMQGGNATTHITAGGGYRFGDAKVSVGYAKKTFKTAVGSTFSGPNDATSANVWVGGSYNLSAKTAVTAAYYTRTENDGSAVAMDEKTNVVMAMLTYAMSKKTTMYVEVDNGKFDDGTGLAVAGAVNKTSGVSAGLDVKF